MKIIAKDNFDRDYIDEYLLCENINSYHGKRIVEFLNSRSHDNSPHYFELKEDDYELYKFEP